MDFDVFHFTPGTLLARWQTGETNTRLWVSHFSFSRIFRCIFKYCLLFLAKGTTRPLFFRCRTMSRNYLSKNDELRRGDYLLSNNREWKAIFQVRLWLHWCRIWRKNALVVKWAKYSHSVLHQWNNTFVDNFSKVKRLWPNDLNWSEVRGLDERLDPFFFAQYCSCCYFLISINSWISYFP